MTSVKARINHQIKSPELRVIDEKGGNLGILSLSEALKKVEAAGLDLIEISPNATPPVAKIMNYGKFLYDESKKQKNTRGKLHTVETKSIQITIGTSEHDLSLKAGKAHVWLKEGHRIKIDLFLRGRAKYMDPKFLEERLERITKLIPGEFKVAERPKKSPKGLSMIIERGVKIK
ncbi:MAG: translation initiation factor IF-3 [Candidatus Taylorbacteria bacterium]|nr:translation initiation factor IF-3 [Candidatus Taylorbacteria bacterium]